MNKTLVFNDVEVNKKNLYDAKKTIPLNLVNVNDIVVSNNNICCSSFVVS